MNLNVSKQVQVSTNERTFSRSTPFDLYSGLLHANFFRAVPCVIGILLGFAACSLAGITASHTNFYRDFRRFHEYISPATFFYPTVSQMVAIAESRVQAAQTIVVIGGNSIFNGIGQQLPDLWSDELQRDLGNKYLVVNFANPGSTPFEGAYWTAEALLLRGHKVIYATVATATQSGTPDGEKIYGYMYWDAQAKQMLLPSHERDLAISERIATADNKEKTRLQEVRACMAMDNLFHFQDFWSAVGYLKFFTVWTQPTARNPLKPRCKYGDFQPFPLPVEKRFGSAEELSLVRRYCSSFFDITSDTWAPRQEAWSRLAHDMRNIVPDPFKKNCLVVIASHPPYYLSRLNADERARLKQATDLTVSNWKHAGYNAFAVGSKLGDADYRDCWHLIGQGGKKLARLVAQEVRAIDAPPIAKNR